MVNPYWEVTRVTLRDIIDLTVLPHLLFEANSTPALAMHVSVFASIVQPTWCHDTP